MKKEGEKKHLKIDLLNLEKMNAETMMSVRGGDPDGCTCREGAGGLFEFTFDNFLTGSPV